MKRVLTFGTFDGIHDGHRNMLKQAKELGDYLIVSLPSDQTSKRLKGVSPRHSEAERVKLLSKEAIVDEITLSDEEESCWQVIDRIKPDVVAIGYDQIELEKSFRKFAQNKKLGTDIVVLEAYKPNQLHNSILNFR